MPARNRRVTGAARRYGTRHKQLRTALLAAFTPGQPCTRCGRPMWDKRLTDLGHTADGTTWTGLEHRACNRREAARRGNRMRSTATAWASARRW